MNSYDRALYGNPSTSYHRFNREGMNVDESNLHLQRPDGPPAPAPGGYMGGAATSDRGRTHHAGRTFPLHLAAISYQI